MAESSTTPDPNVKGSSQQQPLQVTEILSPSLEVFEPFAASQHRSFHGRSNLAHDTIWPPSTPPTPAQITWTANRHLKDVTSDQHAHHVFRYIHVIDPSTGTLAGGARWSFFASSAAADNARPRTVKVDYLDPSSTSAEDQAFTQRVQDMWLGNRLRDLAGPHAALDLLFTHPDYWRRGVASMLVQWGVEEARRQGIKRCAVEASLMGTPMYERNGFVKLYEVRQKWEDEFPDRDVIEWNYMEREE